MDWTVNDLGWPEVFHVIHPENHRSQALARRLGSAKLRPCRLPPPFEGEEMELWGQTAAAWRARGR
jgi:RimJ/RimL family protein N-acetyltransferase